MKPYLHQTKFLKRNPSKSLLLWETGCGKTFAGCEWLNLRKDKKALIVCPKSIVKKWKEDLNKHGANGDVITRDQIKITDISSYKSLIIDEAADFAAPLFDSSRSQRATKLYNHLKNHPDTHILLLSATPIRSTPYNLHTLYCYLGIYWPIKKFRDEFFHITDRFGRMHYEPNKDWRVRIRPYLERVADIVLMSDCVDVPAQSHEVIRVTSPKYVADAYLEPAAAWHEQHRHEQSEEKWKKLKELIDGYQKLIVVAYYREQIEDYVRRIGDERQVYVIHGGIKDQESVVQEANDSKDCVLIVQASLGVGWDADSFSVMAFASQGFSYVSQTQMIGRIKRIHNLHPNSYYYILGGKCDEAVYKTLQAGRDFDPIAYMQNEIP